MPTSVLLAVLAAAGLLALAPALTRRYDITDRAAAERATSTARVLSRRRRRRTVPGSRPVNPPRYRRQSIGTASRARRGTGSRHRHASARAAASRASTAAASAAAGSATRSATRSAPPRATPRRRPQPTAVHRRRRVLVALVLLNLVELAGVFLVGPGFWIGFSVSFTVLLADLVYLRRRADRGCPASACRPSSTGVDRRPAGRRPARARTPGGHSRGGGTPRHFLPPSRPPRLHRALHPPRPPALTHPPLTSLRLPAILELSGWFDLC